MSPRALQFGAPRKRRAVHRLAAGALTVVVALSVPGLPPVGANPDSPEGVTPGLAEARAAADAATAEFSAAQDELGRIDERLRAAEAELTGAEEAMDGLRDAVRQIAVDRYMQVNPTPSIGGGDLLANENAKVLLAVVTGRDLDALEEFRGQRERAEQARSELASARGDFERQQADAEARRAELDVELARLETIEADRLLEVERRRTEQAAAAAAVAAAEAARQAATSTTAPTPATPAPAPGGNPGGSPGGNPGGNPGGGGGWVCPVQGPRSFVDSWMAPRPGGRRHMGVDIMSPRGTPVVLPVGGAVTFRNDGLGGLTFNLNGDDGNYYYGAHLDRYAGLPAGRYPAGTVVGYVGDTGDARGTGTHLHFEIHRGGYGNAVNPYPTTRAHC